jgi:HSP20 family protein
MLSRWDLGWNDVDEMFSVLNDLRATMDRVFEDPVGGRAWTNRALPTFGGTWPRANLIDAGQTLIVAAEVPGLSDKDIKLSLNQDVLTLAGERKADAPEGYLVHRQERPAPRFSRSFALPCAVNPDRASATVKDGILTVTLEKAQEAMPRQISVKAS